MLMRLAYAKSANPVLQSAEQAAKQLAGFADAIFGQGFTPSATHVFLVAIMVCMLANRRP